MTENVRVLDTPQEIEEHEAEWSGLSTLPVQSLEFYWNPMRHRHPAPLPYVVALLRDNRLQAALAGRIDHRPVTLNLGYWKLIRLPLRRILIPAHSYLGSDDVAATTALIEKVVSDLREGRADVADFECLPEGSPLLRAARACHLPFPMRGLTRERSIRRFLTLPATFDEYQRNHIGLMRIVRRFERAFRGQYEYRLLCTEAEIDAFCHGANAVASRTYQRALGVCFLDSEEDRARLLCLARRGAWRAFLASIDGNPVAFWCGYQSGATVSIWWTGYDSAYAKYSPGMVSCIRMFQNLIPCGVSTIDFGPGDSFYKQRMANEFCLEETIHLFAPTVRGCLANLVRAADTGVRHLTHTELRRVAKIVVKRWRNHLAARTPPGRRKTPPR